MNALKDRLAWILANGVDGRGKPWSRRSLSLAAGLAQAHVGMLVRGHLGAQVSSDTIAKIAKAAGVDHRWLATGEGEPRPKAPLDKLPARALAAELARDAGVSETAISAVLAVEVTPDQANWPALWWADAMRRRELDLMRSLGTPRPARAPEASPAAKASEKGTAKPRRRTGSK